MKGININVYNLDNQKWKNQILNNLKQHLINELKSNNITTANIKIYTTNKKTDLNNINMAMCGEYINILLTTNLDVSFIMEALSRVDDVCSINKDVQFLSNRILKVVKQRQAVRIENE